MANPAKYSPGQKVVWIGKPDTNVGISTNQIVTISKLDTSLLNILWYGTEYNFYELVEFSANFSFREDYLKPLLNILDKISQEAITQVTKEVLSREHI